MNLRRATALVLSWVFTATTFWASAPPVAFAAPPSQGPLPALIPGFPDSLSQGQAAEAQPRGVRGEATLRGARLAAIEEMGPAIGLLSACMTGQRVEGTETREESRHFIGENRQLMS